MLHAVISHILRHAHKLIRATSASAQRPAARPPRRKSCLTTNKCVFIDFPAEETAATQWILRARRRGNKKKSNALQHKQACTRIQTHLLYVSCNDTTWMLTACLMWCGLCAGVNIKTAASTCTGVGVICGSGCSNRKLLRACKWHACVVDISRAALCDVTERRWHPSTQMLVAAARVWLR